MKASLQLRFSQNLALTPQLQQSIKLLQLSAMELEQELIQAAEQNPLINYESETSLSEKEPLEQLSPRSLGGWTPIGLGLWGGSVSTWWKRVAESMRRPGTGPTGSISRKY